jgi:DNA-binding winged helix-turn-helix (wHTH) protein
MVLLEHPMFVDKFKASTSQTPPKIHGESVQAIANKQDEKVKLTDLEFKILQYLLVTPRNVITRTEICQHVWGSEMVNTGRLDTQLYNLKKKISAFNGKIKSVNKIGMRILAGDTTFYQAPEKPALQSLHPELRPL